MGDGRDLTWDGMVTVAERLTRRSTDTMKVWAFRRRGLLRVTEGLDAGDNWVHGLSQSVGVGRGRLAGARCNPSRNAASKIGAFLQERPDLR
jgi:hypothetical protein